jgi:hypothetical protein
MHQERLRLGHGVRQRGGAAAVTGRRGWVWQQAVAGESTSTTMKHGKLKC